MSAAHLYVHVPFCTRRCSYCNFAIAVRRSVPVQGFISGVELELDARFPHGWSEPLRSVYLGGGTPSHLGRDGVAALLQSIRARVPVLETAEITLEANPEDVDAASVDAWTGAGVNRVSLGVQTFDDAALEWMHRVHNAARARDALQLIVSRVARVSADLIFALPDDVPRNLVSDVRVLLDSGVGHISLYGLTAEPRTPFARWLERGQLSEAGEGRYEEEFLTLHEALAQMHFEHYEVSSFAKSGERAVHNAAYWSGARYVGIGPAAHGYDGAVRRWNVAAYNAWRGALAGNRDPIGGSEVLSFENRLAEEVYLGLRVREGLKLRPAETAMAAGWCAAGWGEVHNETLRLSPLGWLRLDSLAASLTNLRSR